MDASENSQTDDVQTETHIDDTNGRSSPVLAQTPATIARERERSQSRDGNTRRRRGVGTNRGRSSSKSVSPDRTRGHAGRSGRLSAATNATSSRSRSRSRSPPETPVPDSQGGRSGRNERLSAATNALHTASQNRTRASSGDQSRSPTPTRSKSRSPVETPVQSRPTRGRKKTSVVWSHCSQKTTNGVVVTYCNHCTSNWILSGSTSTALQHLKTHYEKFSPDETSRLNALGEPTPSDAKTPKRLFKSYGDMRGKIAHSSLRGRRIDTNLV